MLQVPYTAAWPATPADVNGTNHKCDEQLKIYNSMGQIVNCKGPGIQLINSIGTRLHLRATTLRPPPQAAQQCEEDELSWLLPCCARGLGSSAKGSVRREGAGTAPSAAASSMDGSH
ncbi:hypothetical protein HL42_2317 [Trichophyton rubrum]|nr:hypothetical protein HL42_2317 [Trichophyton rubrum]